MEWEVFFFWKISLKFIAGDCMVVSDFSKMEKIYFCNKFLSVYCCVFLYLVSVSVYSMSDVNKSDDIYSLSLEELLNTPITSSTLTPKNIMSVPSSVTVFYKKQIENMGADFLFELINFVPGFQSYRQGESSMEYFSSSRGHRSSTKNREILILLDGVRLNREFDNALSTPMLSLYNVEKIEFIRGPGSALYGSNAILGVIDITTVRNSKNVKVSMGSNDRQLNANGYVEIFGGGLDVSVNVFDSGGQSMSLQDFYTKESVTGKDPRNGGDFQLKYQKNKTIFDVMILNREAEGFYISERESGNLGYSKHNREHYYFKQGINWNSDFLSEINLVYSDNEFLPGIEYGAAGFSKANQKESNYEIKIHNDYNINNKNSLQLGMEYRLSDISAFEFETGNFGTFELYPDVTSKLLAAYVQSQNAVGDNTDLILGARYDDYISNGSAFSPRMGLIHSLNESQAIKFLYGEAFRAPTPNELYLQTSDILGNPNLGPESIKTWELIWVQKSKKQNITINAFYNIIESAIVRDDSADGSNFINESSDESFNGVEIDYLVQLSSNLRVNANGSYFRNLPESDFRQSDRLASFIINYNHSKWNLNVSSTYAGERQMLIEDSLFELDAYWLVDMKCQYSINRNLNIFLAGKNILDKDYETPPQRNVLSEPIPNRSNEVAVGFEISL